MPADGASDCSLPSVCRSVVPSAGIRPQHVGQALSFGFFWRERLSFGRICQRLDSGGFITAVQVAVLVTFYPLAKDPSLLMRSQIDQLP